MNKQINDLLNKEMDRKDFLKHVALGALVLSGAGAFLRLLQQSGTRQSGETNTGRNMAYGAYTYGGSAAKRNF